MRKTFLFPFALCSVGFLHAQNGFKIGDEVEVFSAGEAKHGVVVGGYKQTEFGYGTYLIHLEGEKYCNNHTLDGNVKADFVQKRFQPLATTRFAVGNSVEVRRWDGKVYTGKVLGADGERYEVQYTRDGTLAKEWFYVTNMRLTGAATNGGGTAAKNTPAPKPANNNTTWRGQKFNVGDRVMYDDLGFLVTKRYGTVISVDPQKRQYTIRDEKHASLRYTYNCYQVVAPGQKVDNSFFIGTWEVYVTGATSTFVKDGDLYRRYSAGMKLPPLVIKEDGTYTWTTTENKVIRGQWKARDGVPGITLLKALDGKDYTLYEKTEGFATTEKTRDEIGLHHLPSSTGYYMAYRVGANKSCVLAGRTFKK